MPPHTLKDVQKSRMGCCGTGMGMGNVGNMGDKGIWNKRYLRGGEQATVAGMGKWEHGDLGKKIFAGWFNIR